MWVRGEKLPVDFKNRLIYHVGPDDPVCDGVVRPADPIIATPMDKFNPSPSQSIPAERRCTKPGQRRGGRKLRIFLS
jgi:tartrate dehydratase beta subunit/fumarate hydratase class I family protein